MADNAAQSIKELQERLVSADKTLGEMIQRLGKYESWMSTIFSGIAKDAKVSIDEITDYLTKKMRRENLKQSESLMKDILGIEDAKKEVEKVPTMFERVIAQINQRAEQQKGSFTKQIIGAESVKKGAEDIAITYIRSFRRVKEQAEQAKNDVILSFEKLPSSIRPIVDTVLKYMDTSRGHQALVENPVTRYAEALKKIQQLDKQYGEGGVSKAQADIYRNALIKVQEYIKALEDVGKAQEKLNQSQSQYKSNISAVEGVTRRYNDNEQALAKLQQRWEELNVKKQAGLVNQKDFDAQTQKILDEYDRLIAKRKEFEIGDLGKMSYQRKSEREQEEERLAQLRKSNTQARLDDEMRAERMIKQARAERAKKEAEADANMKKAVSQQVTSYKQLSALLKQYNSLKQVKGRTQEEEAALERTRQKIKEIIAEMRKLDSEQKGSLGKARDITEYDRILAKDKEITNEKKKQNDLTKQQKANLNSLLPTLQRLASAFGVAFSVRGLAQFGKKLIETRGEFEIQFVAMKQIIGDVDAATKIWNQTMQQALRSPFKAMQLVTYTKQLAAYRIETEKLFDTTKRLADVSAGLGVDMGRLILAYGQVKAANFLRASEIRQFTEAGVNILGELSKYFTEIEGRAVSTAQVMERVTKRMVTFADVEEIFKRMTDEGGQFFDMQEVQADTVKGQIAKLHDAYDQMLNTIGKANQGTLRNFIGALNRIVRNWDKFASVLKTVIGIFVTFKVAQTTAAIQMIRAGKAADAEALGISGLTAKLINLVAVEKSTTEATLTLSTALKQLNSSKGGWIGVAVSAALTAAMAIYDYYQRATKLSKELNEITSQTQMRARKSTTDYEQMAEKIRDVNTSENERKETLSKLKQMYEDILPSRMLEIEYITKEGNAYDEAKESIRAYYEEKRKQESLDKVYDKYGNYVEKAREDLIEVYKRVYGYAHVDLKDSDINAVVDELIRQYENGELVLSNYTETLEKLIQLQSGVDLTDKLTWKDDDAVFYFEKIIRALDTLDDKIEEVTGSTAEFAGKQKELLQTNVFGKAEKNLSDSIAALSKDGVLKSFNEELESQIVNYEDFARLAYETFKETFKEEYETNPTFFDDQFEKELEKRLGNLGIELKKNWEKNGDVIKHSIVDNQKTINSEIEKLAGQTGIADKEILRQFQLDTDVELDKWIQNQLSKIDLYKTDLLRIQKGLTSDMTDEHIAMLQTLEPFLPLWEEYLKGLTPTKKTGGSGRKTHENASKLISLIKEMRSEYDKLSKSAYGYAKSEEKVRESYAQSVEKILGKAGVTKDYDFTTNEGMIAALDKVLAYANKLGPEAAAEVQKYIDQLETEIEINAQVKIRKDFGKQIEEMFSNYDLTIDLEKLNLPTDELVGIFNLDVTTLDELRRFVDDFYNKQIELGNNPTELVEQVEGYYKKIDEMEKKELRERLKTYSKYLAEGQVEALKIHLEELKKMAELDKLYEQGYFTDTQYKDISNKIRKETDEKLAKNDWQQFKESDFYVTMFEDMSRVSSESIDIMIKRLKSLRKSVNDLNPKQAKEIVKAIEKLEKAKLERSPLKSFLDDWKAAAKWRKENDTLVKQLGFYASGEEYWSKEQDKQSKKVAELRLEYDELVKNGTPADAADVKKRLDFEEEELSKINEILEDRRQKLDEINQKQNEGYAAQQRVLEGLAKGAQYFNDIASTAETIATDIMDMMDGVSDATKKYAKDIASIATNVGMLAVDFAKAFASKGTDVGSMIDGILRTWNIIKSSLSASEREINETIEESTNALKDLEVQLERVSKARERAWDTQMYTFAQKELENNIQEQIKAYDALISAEEERKSSDKEQIRTWKQEREELFEQLEDERETLLKEFGGIGESEYKSAAQGFVDAWKSAFLETGDGLQGLQDHFDEFLNEWFVKQATMRVAGKMLEPLFRDIDNAVEKYGDGGTSVMMSELAKVRERFGIIAPELSDALEELTSLWGLGGEGSLSGLAAGIQGMTEEQANILEAYWNSVRGYTANIDMNVSRIAQILGAGGDNTNPMLAQMTLVAQNTNSINTLLQSVTKSGHSQGGYGIKVFAN